MVANHPPLTFPRWWIILLVVAPAVANIVLGLLGWTVIG
jgi:hypothetical protein